MFSWLHCLLYFVLLLIDLSTSQCLKPQCWRCARSPSLSPQTYPHDPFFTFTLSLNCPGIKFSPQPPEGLDSRGIIIFKLSPVQVSLSIWWSLLQSFTLPTSICPMCILKTDKGIQLFPLQNSDHLVNLCLTPLYWTCIRVIFTGSFEMLSWFLIQNPLFLSLTSNW